METVIPKAALRENPNIGNIDRGISTGEKRKENADVKVGKRDDAKPVKTDDGHSLKKQKVSQGKNGKSSQQSNEGYLMNIFLLSALCAYQGLQ